MKQEATRAHKDWALDKVAIHNDVLKLTREEILSPPSVCMQRCFSINFSI